jgi:hypothetical protein
MRRTGEASVAGRQSFTLMADHTSLCQADLATTLLRCEVLNERWLFHGTQSPGIGTSHRDRRPVEMTVALLLVCVTGAITALMALVVVVRAPR